MTRAFQAPAGTRDVLAPESARWETLVACFAGHVGRAGYGLVINPMFEDVGVFVRGMGESTDVVGKEMYEFSDKGDRRIALRPEGTAPIVRAFIEHRPPAVWKAWYVTPAFRYERPQAGRYRQHHQVGVEAIGSGDPALDVEVICLAHGFAGALGLSAVKLKLSSIGDAACRPAYLEKLKRYLEARVAELCSEHQERWSVNPLRVLDCKREQCKTATQHAPRLAESLCADCATHFDQVRDGLSDLGIACELDHRLVRGLDYYTRTTFELASEALDAAQDALGGGGRYDGLVEALGGPPTPGVGFSMGIERLLLACDAEGTFGVPTPILDAFVVDTTGGRLATRLTHELRAAGLRASRAFDQRSMKAQLKLADRSGARVALIVGAREAEEGTVTLHPLRSGGSESGKAHEEVVKLSEAVDRLRAIARGCPE